MEEGLGPPGFLSHRIVGVGGIEFAKTMNFEIFIFENYGI